MPKIYVLNGAIYIDKWNILKNNRSFYTSECIPFIMDKRKDLDINDLLYLEFVVFLMKKEKSGCIIYRIGDAK